MYGFERSVVFAGITLAVRDVAPAVAGRGATGSFSSAVARGGQSVLGTPRAAEVILNRKI